MPQGLGHLVLHDRPRKRAAIGHADGMPPPLYLKDEMRKAIERVPLSEIDHPFLEYRGVDQGVTPKHFRDEGRVRDEAGGTPRHGDQVVVHMAQKQSQPPRPVASQVMTGV
jgi:hypothetical protein